MGGPPRVTGPLAALKRFGFAVVRTDGSYRHLHREVGVAGVMAVAVHAGRVLQPGTLRSIPRQAGLSVEAFLALL